MGIRSLKKYNNIRRNNRRSVLKDWSSGLRSKNEEKIKKKSL